MPVLEAYLPAGLAGWEAHDTPIGATERLQKVSADVLRYDRYFYRTYTRGPMVFSVFVAYWRNGRQSPNQTAQHTPDRCWTMNGAICEEARHGVRYALGTTRLPGAQWRRFMEPNGAKVHVLFWHRVGDRFFDYGDRLGDVLSPVTFWTEAGRHLLGQNSEQYFYRIVSNVPPETLWSDPEFQQVVTGLVAMGLRSDSGE